MQQEKPMQPGDIVPLKSGGPALTVLGVEGDQVRCLFFSDEIGDFREATIPAFALETFELPELDMEDLEEDDEDEMEEDEPEKEEKPKPKGKRKR